MTAYLKDTAFKQSDISGLFILGLLLLAAISVGAILRFYLIRRSKRNALKDYRRYGDTVRSLSNYEQLRIKDFFRREVLTRNIENYQDKFGDVGSQVFCVVGDATLNKVDTLRGTIFSYIDISGLEMLVPTAAMPYLESERNRAEFVMVGDLAFVIRLNDRFDLTDSVRCDGCQKDGSLNSIGDHTNITKLSPLSVERDFSSSNAGEKIKDIVDDRLLVMDDSLSAVEVEFLLGVYLVIIFLVCGFLPSVVVIFGALGGYFYESINVAAEIFSHSLHYGIFIGGTLPIAIIWWVSVRVLPPNDIVVIFDRSNSKVLFYKANVRRQVSVEWDLIYSVVENSEWTTSYGYMAREVFLELASENRNSQERACVRLTYSSEVDARRAWRAIQDFMNGNLQSLEFDTERSCNDGDKHAHYGGARITNAERLQHENRDSICKKSMRIILFCLLGGPLPHWLTSWVSKQRNLLIWKRAKEDSHANCAQDIQ